MYSTVQNKESILYTVECIHACRCTCLLQCTVDHNENIWLWRAHNYAEYRGIPFIIACKTEHCRTGLNMKKYVWTLNDRTGLNPNWTRVMKFRVLLRFNPLSQDMNYIPIAVARHTVSWSIAVSGLNPEWHVDALVPLERARERTELRTRHLPLFVCCRTGRWLAPRRTADHSTSAVLPLSGGPKLQWNWVGGAGGGGNMAGFYLNSLNVCQEKVFYILYEVQNDLHDISAGNALKLCTYKKFVRNLMPKSAKSTLTLSSTIWINMTRQA